MQNAEVFVQVAHLGEGETDKQRRHASFFGTNRLSEAFGNKSETEAHSANNSTCTVNKRDVSVAVWNQSLKTMCVFSESSTSLHFS